MEQRELLSKLNGRVTFTYVLEKELFALRDYLTAQFELNHKENKQGNWNKKAVLDKNGKHLKSPSIQQEVVIGGQVTSLLDFSAIRILEPVLAREALDNQTPIIEDIYMTIDDGLGTLNLCMHEQLYEEMKEQGDILQSAYIFKGIATVVDRSHVDNVQMKVIPNSYQSHHISVMVYDFEKLD